MQKKAVFLFPENCENQAVPQALAEVCSEENYTVESQTLAADAADLSNAGIETPTIFFLPISILPYVQIRGI